MQNKFSKPALIGFAGKGPANTPIVVKSIKEFNNTFGHPDPDMRDSNLAYAAEYCLRMIDHLVVFRALGDAATASVPIASIDSLVKAQSQLKGPYFFKTNQFFRWKLDNVLSGKTLVVLASDKPISAEHLAAELNDQLVRKDGIQFYACKDCIAVRTTGNVRDLELISIQNSLYGPWGNTGIGINMTPARKTGKSQCSFNLNLPNSNIQLVISGSDNPSVDNIVQIVSLHGLTGECNAADIVDYINNAELPLLPGGWRAFAEGDRIGFSTNHSGRDASITIKPSPVASLLGFDAIPAKGASPKDDAIFFGSNETSLIISADSPGTDGNYTRVVIENDEDTFALQIYNNGLKVESWSGLSKNPQSKLYVEDFINLASNWIRVTDNKNNPLPPKDGSYLLGDDRIPGAVKGSDGDNQDDLLVEGIAAVQGFDCDIIAVPGHTSEKVIKALGEQSRLAIIDTPMEFSYKDAHLWSKNFSGPLALFWPWLKLRDSHNRRNVWVPPSGLVIATLCKNKPWQAVTGMRHGLLPGVLDVFTKVEEKGLTTVVNPILRFGHSEGFYINSQKTFVNESISEKRTIFFIEKTVRSIIHSLLPDYKQVVQACEHLLGEFGCEIGDRQIITTEDGFKIGVELNGKQKLIDFNINRFGKIGGALINT